MLLEFDSKFVISSHFLKKLTFAEEMLLSFVVEKFLYFNSILLLICYFLVTKNFKDRKCAIFVNFHAILQVNIEKKRMRSVRDFPPILKHDGK